MSIVAIVTPVYEDEASRHHTPIMNAYSLSKSILDADLVIPVAKLKTHRKSGVTGALKILIGVINEKRWLPHHRVGTPAEGGDITPNDAPLDRNLDVDVRVHRPFRLQVRLFIAKPIFESPVTKRSGSDS